MNIKVCVAGATGWAGSALSKGIFLDNELALVSAVSRKMQGKNLAEELKLGPGKIPVFSDVPTALSEVPCDVLVEYTKPTIAKQNVVAALGKGINVVIGTSGLTEEDYAEIEEIALKNNASVLAVGNFALTVVLLQKFSQIAAKYIPNFEIIDYAHQDKVDSPSGTARELAKRLSQVQKPTDFVSGNTLIGPAESRGAKLNDVRVHSVRLPGHVISIESIFGLKDEKLTLRHDAGASAEPYVKGALLAIKQVNTFKGLKRGLDSVMDLT